MKHLTGTAKRRDAQCHRAWPGTTLFAALALHGLTAPVAAQGLAPAGCLIQPFDVIDLATPVEGIVTEIHVERGDLVTKGQPVARLDTELEIVALEAARARAADESAIRAAEARLAFLDDTAERTERLAARNAISESTADEAMMEADTARQRLEEAHIAHRIAGIEARAAAARLEQKILRSPIDGLITERHVSPGEFRDGTAPLVTIARLDRLLAEAYVPIDYYPHLAIGQTVTLHPEPPVGGAYAATITVIDQVFDAASATLGIVMELPNPGLTLPAGLRCEVAF